MQLSFYKYITTLLFLVTFLVPRVASLHAIDHLAEEEDDIPCELCDITLHSQQSDLFLGDFSFEDTLSVDCPSTVVINSKYNSPTEKIVSPTTVYNKPPPLS